jgi:phage-related tail fiber protein
LPAASSVNPGFRIAIADESGSCSTTNSITIVPNGSDLISGGTSTQLIQPFGVVELLSNGVNAWLIIYMDAADVVGSRTGEIAYFGMNTAPNGWLVGNGASLSTTTYAKLFAKYAYTYGGSGASFNIIDLRGVFPRGWDNGRGLDTNRVFGSYQADMFASHGHGVTDPSHGHGVFDPWHSHGFTAAQPAGGGYAGGGFGAFSPQGSGTNGAPTGISIAGAFTGIGIQANGSVETAPKNIALLGCVKY